MNIDFNNGTGIKWDVAQNQATSAGALAGAGAAKGQAQAGHVPEMTITQAAAAPEDIEAAGIPDAALSRDDSLGALVNAAFSLPPPAMPDFSKIS